ncbi:SHQ1 protein-domain-containing protein [Neocallimastix lanati (nom. inval.)]|nr:SHQ1 protein-domain-containing protein [Neocallimastix sp. JGI-2020a]
MITPSFQINQDENFVNIIIKCPNIKAKNVEFFVDGTEFKFYIKPYYLRIIEDGREKATYNIKTSEVTVSIPKETPGEFFEDLGTLENPKLNENDEIDWYIPQELPKTENNDFLINSHYGFDNKYYNLGRQLQEIGSDVVNREFYRCFRYIHTRKIQKEKKDEITQLENEVSKMNIDIDVDPANPSSSSTNNNNNNNNTVESTLNNTTEPNKNIPTSNVLIDENDNNNNNNNEMFKSTSTLNLTNASNDSLFHSEDSLAQKTIRSLIIELDSDNTYENTNVSMDTQKIDEFSKPDLTLNASFSSAITIETNKVPRLDENVEWIEKIPLVRSLDKKIDSFFKFTEEENRMMTNLPNIEFNTVNEKALYLGLVDILFAYSDSTVELPWTIVNLSSSLSLFVVLYDILFIDFDLSMKCIMDIYVLFKLGKIAILKALLQMKKLFESQENYYIYNRCWIDDYCIWTMQRLKSLASELHTFKVPKQEIGFDLEECEMIAKEIDA